MADNIIEVELKSTSTYTAKVWQYDYGQILKISGELVNALPKAVEVQFSLTQKYGDTTTRIGNVLDGVLDVGIPNDFLNNTEKQYDYYIYAYIFLNNKTSGNTKYEIVIPVISRPKPEEPTEEPLPEPNIFHEAISAVNDAADRAEQAEQNANDSASKAEEAAASASASAKAAENTKTEALEEIGNKKQDALSSIQAKKEESLSAIRTQEENSVSKVTEHTNEEIQRFQNAANESKGALDRSIEEAGEKKTALDGSIRTADSSKANLDESVESAGTAKSGLDASTGKAKDAKTELDGSIRSAGEKQLALDATVEHANTVDASLKEHIGSAEQIQENVEQIAKNKADISSLKEDTAALKDGKITKFYASNQGETHLVDSDKGLVQDIKIYGQSEQSSTTGAQLFNENIEIKNRGVTIKINGSTATFKGTVSDEANARVNYQKNIKLKPGKYTASSSNEKIKADFSVEKANNEMIYNEHIEIDGTEKEVKIRALFGLGPSAKGDVINETTNIMLNDGDIALPYEPYTGGIPSPSPDYPQEIKSVVNPTIKVVGKNLLPPNLRHDDMVKINIKKGVTLTLICENGVVSKGGNLVLKKANGETMWLGFDKGSVKKQIRLYDDAVALYYWFDSEPSENYALYIGDENTYEPYKEQSIQLPITLNAIPVSSGSNVTIDGQQYIADRVVEKDGVFGIERNIREIHTNTKTMNNSEEYPGWNKVEGISDVEYYNKNPTEKMRELIYISNIAVSNIYILAQNCINDNNVVYFIKDNVGYSQSELIAKAIDVDMYIRLQDAIFEPLPGDIQAKLRTLVTNYPVTNISITSDQLDGYTVFNYPISMANGWNYVKQQLNDNRDYIYDMDTKTQDIDIQSAEAYVNSEYAVALTELEV